jgi:hypothetical protein
LSCTWWAWYLVIRSSVSASPSLLGDSVSLEVPGVVHHELKVVITLDAAGNVVVVFLPLGLSYTSIAAILAVITVSGGVVDFEGVEELEENVIFSLFTTNDIGVLVGEVDSSDVIEVNSSRLILVHNVEGLHGNGGTELVHLTDNSS